MVHVAHHGDDRWTQQAAEILGVSTGADEVRLGARRHRRAWRRGGGFLWLEAEGRRYFRRGVVIDDLIDAGEDTLRDQRANNLIDRNVQQIGEVFHHHLRRNRDRPGLFRRRGHSQAAGTTGAGSAPPIALPMRAPMAATGTPAARPPTTAAGTPTATGPRAAAGTWWPTRPRRGGASGTPARATWPTWPSRSWPHGSARRHTAGGPAGHTVGSRGPGSWS